MMGWLGRLTACFNAGNIGGSDSFPQKTIFLHTRTKRNECARGHRHSSPRFGRLSQFVCASADRQVKSPPRCRPHPGGKRTARTGLSLSRKSETFTEDNSGIKSNIPYDHSSKSSSVKSWAYVDEREAEARGSRQRACEQAEIVVIDVATDITGDEEVVKEEDTRRAWTTEAGLRCINSARLCDEDLAEVQSLEVGFYASLSVTSTSSDDIPTCFELPKPKLTGCKALYVLTPNATSRESPSRVSSLSVSSAEKSAAASWRESRRGSRDWSSESSVISRVDKDCSRSILTKPLSCEASPQTSSTECENAARATPKVVRSRWEARQGAGVLLFSTDGASPGSEPIGNWHRDDLFKSEEKRRCDLGWEDSECTTTDNRVTMGASFSRKEKGKRKDENKGSVAISASSGDKVGSASKLGDDREDACFVPTSREIPITRYPKQNVQTEGPRSGRTLAREEERWPPIVRAQAGNCEQCLNQARLEIAARNEAAVDDRDYCTNNERNSQLKCGKNVVVKDSTRQVGESSRDDVEVEVEVESKPAVEALCTAVENLGDGGDVLLKRVPDDSRGKENVGGVSANSGDTHDYPLPSTQTQSPVSDPSAAQFHNSKHHQRNPGSGGTGVGDNVGVRGGPIGNGHDSNSKGRAGGGRGLRRFEDRPIIVGLAVHLPDDGAQWDGRGIPNSTKKYREDQKVQCYSTPFEVMLEQQLATQLSPSRVFEDEDARLARDVYEDAAAAATTTTATSPVNRKDGRNGREMDQPTVEGSLKQRGPGSVNKGVSVRTRGGALVGGRNSVLGGRGGGAQGDCGGIGTIQRDNFGRTSTRLIGSTSSYRTEVR